MPDTRCDAPGCREKVRRGHLMCLHHWRRLPRPLKQAIREGWINRRGDLGLQPWFEARNAARQWLTDNPEPATTAAADHAAYVDRVQQGAYWHD